MKTELNIQATPVERGRIAAILTAEKSALTAAIAESTAEVMCRFVGTAVAPYFVVPNTEHMRSVIDAAQVKLPELRIALNRVLAARDPSDAVEAMNVIMDAMSFADSTEAIIIRPYDWTMMNMLKHAEGMQQSLLGIYDDLAPQGHGLILGEAAYDLSNTMTGLSDEQFAALPQNPQISDMVGRTRRSMGINATIDVTHAVLLAVGPTPEDPFYGIFLVPRRAGGAYIVRGRVEGWTKEQYAQTMNGANVKGKRSTPAIKLNSKNKLIVMNVLRWGLYYRSGSVHYISPLKELVLLRLLIHMQRILEGNRPLGSNYRYYEAPIDMMAKLEATFIRIAADSLLGAKGDLTDYFGTEDGTILLSGANLARGFDSLPLFISLMACSNSIRTIEQMLLLAQARPNKGAVQCGDAQAPDVALDRRFVRWVSEELLNPVLEYRNEVLSNAGIADVSTFVRDPTLILGGPDFNAIVPPGSSGTIPHAAFISNVAQMTSITELVKLEIADLVAAERVFLNCVSGGYSRAPTVRYNGRFRDLDHMYRLIEAHISLLSKLMPNEDDIRSAASLPYRHINFHGAYSAYEMGRTILPIQYGIYDLGKRITAQLGAGADVETDAGTMNIFTYLQSSVIRYEPRYMFPFLLSEDDGATLRRVVYTASGPAMYAITEGAEVDQVMTELRSPWEAQKFWANTAPLTSQYREIGIVIPCWDRDMYERLSNTIDMPTDRTYFPYVKGADFSEGITLTVTPKLLDEGLRRMMELEFLLTPLNEAAGKYTLRMDRIAALHGIGILMPYVPRLAQDLKASWMDDISMVDIDSDSLYATAGTLVIPMSGDYAMNTLGLEEVDRWRAPTLDRGFGYKGRSAAYGSIPLTFDAE